MPSNASLDVIPLWLLFIAILLLVMFSLEGGYRLGIYRRLRSDENEAPIAEMVAAVLGLLAFILAFTFGLAATRFDNRRQLVQDEANAIGTTYLRAGILPERSKEIRALLQGYVDVRLDAVRSGRITEGIRQSENIQVQLWTHAAAVAEKNPNSIVVGLFIQSLNEMIDLHANRVATVMRNRIPTIFWIALFGIASSSFCVMGFHAGIDGTRRPLAVLPVAFAFSVMIGLIADLDRPLEGFLEVNQQALIDVRQSMK